MKREIELIEIPVQIDPRGKVTWFEFNDLPFMPKRFFTTTASSVGMIRGEHGHFVCEQIIFSLQGEISILVKTLECEQIYKLIPTGKAIYLPAGTWSAQTFATGQEILGCLASHPYDPTDVFESI
jgi:UDP-2-acetamido-3-amino-2,3-dideoxy-glucuronate N-acetyltransferase